MIATRTPTFSPTTTLDFDLPPLVVRDSRKKGKTRRRVSFFPETHIKYTIHHNDYTAAERRRTWLTMDELRWMKRSCQKLARELSEPDSNNNNNNSNSDRCIRGLEGRTRQGLTKRKRIKNAARDAVLWEQGLQRKWGVSIDGFSNEKILADTYYEFTEFSQIEAHMLGLRDAVEAFQVSSAAPAATATLEGHDSGRTTTTTSASTTTASNTPMETDENDNHSIATTKATIGGARRISKPCPDPPGLNVGSRMRNLQSLSQLTSTRRLLTDAFFQV